MIKRLKESHKEDPYDLLVVGGGATGAGISVDAATRGLKVAMVERDDFASGKNIHVEKIKKRILSL
jgi:glycerol-3-phosphate dehydrogenase